MLRSQKYCVHCACVELVRMAYHVETPAKRKIEFDASEVNEEAKSGVSVHGLLVQLSPIKCSKERDVKYLEGRISDGKGMCRFVFLTV